MCGITGIGYNDPTHPVDADQLRRMAQTLVNRGPDEEGYWQGRGIGLGIRRLSVIDPAGGQQPITNESGDIVVVCNGEIYNFVDLRNELQQRGHTFRSRSDAEVIVHLYEECGAAAIERLWGMFGLAIWDRRSETLLLARDRIGVKPLYFLRDASRIVFGSELKAILALPDVPRAVNLAALDDLLSWGFIEPPQTPFVGIEQLPPATRLLWNRGTCRIERYWQIEPPARPVDSPEQQLREEFLSLLQDAVRRRMVSDVPWGAFLSGGLDSSTIVALMRRETSQPLRTFSIGFSDSDFSELPTARRVAAHCGTEHHEQIVAPRIVELLPKLVEAYDEPFYDSSAIPTYHVCSLARQHVTVALSGDGGDELLAGYNLHRANQAVATYRKVPRWIRRHLFTRLATSIPEGSGPRNWGRVAREFVRGAEVPLAARFERWSSKVKQETCQSLYRAPELRGRLRDEATLRFQHLWDRARDRSELGQLLYIEMLTALPHDMLTKVDRMSMAHRLEVRSPLLDHRLFEWAARLPDNMKLRGRESKYLLRRLVSDLGLPAELLARPKRGFSIPLDRWLRQDDLAQYTRAILDDPHTHQRGYFEPSVVVGLLDEHASGRHNRGRELWTLLTIELWHRSYIDLTESPV